MKKPILVSLILFSHPLKALMPSEHKSVQCGLHDISFNLYEKDARVCSADFDMSDNKFYITYFMFCLCCEIWFICSLLCLVYYMLKLSDKV